MGRIKKREMLGVFLFILVLVGLGIFLYPRQTTQHLSPIGRSLTPIAQNPAPITQDPKSTPKDTELTIFRDLFEPLITPPPERPAREVIESLSLEREQDRPPSPPPFTRSSLKLVGVVMGSPPVAVLEESSARLSHIVKEGDVINEEEIVAIRQDSVVIKKDGQELTLMLWQDQEKGRL